jgi:formylglycine-generating enzyme required for sulfatase activity
MDSRRLVFGASVLLVVVGLLLASFTPGGWLNRGGGGTTIDLPFGSVTLPGQEKSSPWPLVGYVALGLGAVGLVAAFAMKSPRPSSMSRTRWGCWAGFLLMSGLIACHPLAQADSFLGAKPGDERAVAGVKLCWCPPGKFLMGSPPNEPERRPGEDQVEVTLTRGFWMGKYEVTQGNWKRVMGKLPGPLTAELPEGDDFPVGNVNFAETEAFCQKLTELGRQAGTLPKDWEFRLPTEAQWEYACRAGTTTATAFGDQLSSKQANFKGKPYNGAEPGPSLGRAAKVGSYPANAWGLHDMHGNTFEWCRDWYHAKLPGGVDPDLYAARATAQVNRTGDVSRARRGGAWTDDGWPCRSAFRLRFEPERRYDHIGFRVVAVRP